LHDYLFVLCKGGKVYFFYYFPVGLDIRVRKAPTITIYLAAVCVITFLIYRYAPYGGAWNLSNLVFLPARPTLATSLSHLFLHAGYLHLAGNMVYLVLFGRVIEDRFGPGRFFAIFALSAMAGAWTHLLLTRAFSPEFIMYGVIGASGATSGLLGAYLVRFYFTRINVAYWIFMPLQGVNRAGRSHVPGLLAIPVWFLYQGAYALMQFGSGGMSVAYSVHIGGFACGIVLALLFGALSGARAERPLSRAREHVEKAEWFAAQGEFLNYLHLKPDDGEVHAEAARVFLCGAEKGRARFHYAEAVSNLLKAGRRGDAEALFMEAMRSIEGFAMPEKEHLGLACGMERSLKYSGAMKAYGNFMTRYPDSREIPFVLLRMAGIHEKRYGRPDGAISCYAALVEGYPGDAWADFAMAELERLGRGCIALGERDR